MGKFYKINLSILVLLVTVTSLFAQTGSIKGNIKTKDGEKAEFVNVGIKETGKGTISDKDGNYTINEVAPGNYTIQVSMVGLETKFQTIEVKAGEVSTVDFSLNENSQQLKEVVITDSKSLNEKPVSIGKIAIKPMDLPQSIAVIDKELLGQQQTLRMSDALKNFNGVYQMGSTGGGQEEIAGRGFAYGSSNTFKNGVRFNNAAMPEMGAIERMEVLKGSAAILFGNVAAGGVINLVTKKPVFETGGELTFRAGSFDFYKPSVDVYGSLNKKNTAAYRVYTTYEKSRSFRDEVKGERYYINPSFLFKIGKKTDLLVEGDFLKDNRTSDFGVGAINYELIDIPRDRFLGAKWSYYNTEQQSITSTLTHHFNDNWEIRNVTSFQNFKSDLFGTTRPNASSQFILANGDWTRGIQRTKISDDYSISQVDLTGKFSTGFIKHTLLVGVEVDQYLTTTTAFKGITKYDVINVFDLNKYTQRNDIPDLTVNTITKSPIKRAGAYVQDLISLHSKVKLLVGVRNSYLETGSNVLTYATKAEVSSTQYDNAITPRVGLVFQPLKSMSLFGSYANSFTPNTGTDITGKQLAPSFIDQYEAGIKNDFFKGLLSVNATVYQIINSNLAQISLENGNTNSNIKELAGEVTSKGAELDIMTKSWRGFNVVGGYSYNETKYTKSNTYIVGSLLRYNPNHTANANIYYSFNNKWLKGLNISAGAFYMGERVAGRSTRVTVTNDTYKLIKVPAFTQLDASIGYARNKFSVRIKVSNITDVLSYHIHDDNSVNPIAPRQFAATIGYKF